jgi:hypothetical protein
VGKDLDRAEHIEVQGTPGVESLGFPWRRMVREGGGECPDGQGDGDSDGRNPGLPEQLRPLKERAPRV